ncbi:hypothetical protein DXG01_013880 [Tephrocybe rancida]|nr:hypothetical protein DXG01_013880 [Tephrocybe rancida]
MPAPLTNPAGSSGHSNIPQPYVALEDPVLASELSLPDDSCIVYARFSPSSISTTSAPTTLDSFRLTLLRKNGSKPLLESILPSVHIGTSSFIYVFLIASLSSLPESLSVLSSLTHDGLTPAVRNRVIDDVVRGERRATRLGGGFVLSQPRSKNEWGVEWAWGVQSRPMLYTHLQIHLTFSPTPRLLIHPLPTPTSLRPLAPFLPLPPGTPLTLLPFSTPAFLLHPYVGPTSSLSLQFKSSLEGMGCPEPGKEFVLVYIQVEHSQGEGRALVVLWPASLCCTSPRAPLGALPMLPAPLQPSPHLLPPSLASDSGPPPSASVSLPQNPQTPHAPQTLAPPYPTQTPYAPPPPPSPHAPIPTLHRLLTSSHHTIQTNTIRSAATEVGAYVDAVARERERERERLRKERESGVKAQTAQVTPLLTTPLTQPPPVVPPPVQVQAQPVQNQIQNFYPSPPQSNLTPQAQGMMSPPAVPSSVPPPPPPLPINTPAPIPITPVQPHQDDVPPPEPQPQPPVPPQPQVQQAQQYDAWGAHAGMDMDMGFGMDMNMDLDFNMDMNMNIGAGMDFNLGFNQPNAHDSPSYARAPTGGNGASSSSHAAMDFDEAFTDDDFSFFDRPTPSVLPLGSLPTPLSSTLPAHALPTPGTLPTPTPGPLPPTPALAPSSPHGASPRTPAGPATPRLVLVPEVVVRGAGAGGGEWDPIPFAEVHREMDGKYLGAGGKFAFSPVFEEEEEEGKGSEDGKGGWGRSYKAATDPRVGVVRKLAGVKRKLTSQPQGRARKHSMSWSWMDDWAPETPSGGTESSLGSPMYESPDATTSSEEEEEEEEDSPMPSRIHTPPPPHLPPGPSLLSTHFAHSALLPLASPSSLFTSSPAPANLNLNANVNPHAQIQTAPTPVSPAAELVCARGREAVEVLGMVCREAVENGVWGGVWRGCGVFEAGVDSGGSGVLGGGQRGPGEGGAGEVWLADVLVVKRMMGSVRGLRGALVLGDVLHSCDGEEVKENGGKLRLLPAPHLSLSKSSSILHVLPTALRFWEKLGLGPRGGPKDGLVFVLFEEQAVPQGHAQGQGESRGDMVQAWLADVMVQYEGRHLGKLTPGKSMACVRDGLVPLRFDSSFRKTLASLIASLPCPPSHLIFFVVTPLGTLTLSSPTLRHIFSALSKARTAYSKAQLHFHLVPESLVLSPSLSVSPIPSSGSPAHEFVLGLYDRLQVPVDRTMARRFFENGERVRRYFQEPAFTLARVGPGKAKFVRAAKAALDVLDRGTMVQVGYAMSRCGRWVLAACVDERGEAHELGVWGALGGGEEEVQGDEEGGGGGEGDENGEGEEQGETRVVRKVWEFAMQFMKKANVEWRVVFSKLGPVGEAELDAWTSWIDANSRGLRIASFTLLSVEPDAPWTFCSTRPQHSRSPTPKSPHLKAHTTTRTSSNAKGPQNIFTDVSTTTFVTPPYTSLPQSYPPTFADLGLSLSHIPEADQHHHTLSLPHLLPLLPRSTTTLVSVPNTPSPTAISMLHLHLLHTVRPPGATAPLEDDSTLHTAITQNFHELAVLARARWRLDVNPVLPFHLAAVEAMRIALGRDQYGIDAADTA